MKRKYDSAIGAFFTEAARGRYPEQQTQIMLAMSRLFEQLTLKGHTLTPEWFRQAENREKVERRVPSDVRDDILRGFDAVANAKVDARESHHRIVISGEGPDASR